MMLLFWVIGYEHFKTVYWSHLNELKCPVRCWTVQPLSKKTLDISTPVDDTTMLSACWEPITQWHGVNILEEQIPQLHCCKNLKIRRDAVHLWLAHFSFGYMKSVFVEVLLTNVLELQLLWIAEELQRMLF